MIMEYVEGTTLASELEHGPIPSGDALHYIDQVLDALSYAHQQGVIHRDIKPANMMLMPKGTVKLMDFGIARSGTELGMTATGTTLGSLNYMSPEQVKCEPIDARSDLYSAGVSLYEMVTGQRPFKADSSFSIMQAHLEEIPRPPLELKADLPPALSQIILMAMAKNPAQRFQSAEAFKNALQGLASDLGVALPAARAAAGPAGQGAAGLSNTSSGPAMNRTVRAPTLPAPNVRQNETVIPANRADPRQAPAASARGLRGVYITLGAVLALAVLVAAGIGVPHWIKTRAGGGAALPAPSPVPADASPAPVDKSNAPAETIPTPPPPAVHTATGIRNPQNQPPQSVEQPVAAPPEPQPPAVDPAQLAALDREMDQLSSRASAVNSSLEGLQHQQAAQGFGLRGDIVSSRERMQTYLGKAQAALQAQDVEGARRYMDLSETEVDKLEKFLGR
jgi:serine/threonine-protein kinase